MMSWDRPARRCLRSIAVVAAGLVVAVSGCADRSGDDSSASRITVPDPEDGGASGGTSATESTDGSGTTQRVDRDGDGLSDPLDLCPETPGEVDGCPDENDDSMPDTVLSPTSATPTTPPRMITVEQRWYGAQADEVVLELDQLGIVAVEFEVCGDDLGRGEVQAITTDDGEVLVDAGGAIAGGEVESGSVVEVRVGSGQPCEG
jgi:hypothetical protein